MITLAWSVADAQGNAAWSERLRHNVGPFGDEFLDGEDQYQLYCSHCQARIWVIDILSAKKRLRETTYKGPEKDVRILLVLYFVALAIEAANGCDGLKLVGIISIPLSQSK